MVIYEEKQEHIFLETNPTKDNEFLIINSLSKDDSEILIMNMRLNEDNGVNQKVELLFDKM